MAEGTEENTTIEAFGLPLDRFEAAVDAIVELRDSGKILLFLNRRGAIKLVGEEEDFRAEFSRRANDVAIDVEVSRIAKNEIRQLISTALRIPDNDASLEFLERYYIEDYRKKPHPQIEEFRRQVRPKIEIVTSRIITEAMRQRGWRLSTATGACIEEVDYEIVCEREDSYRGRRVTDAFLRLRLRYTDGSRGESPYYGYYFLPFEGADGGHASNFELECDLSDIDMLIKRLSDAKQRLLKDMDLQSGEE
ncbi:hypothetical protein TA3x_000511 [Tundrisphaera sp. TA3]|uniref:hypothetical protein n=1 Tax=Tundrisphaera sp. TA3 TaxID=3435775 RepID=UPI003EBB66AF